MQRTDGIGEVANWRRVPRGLYEMRYSLGHEDHFDDDLVW